MTSIDLLVDAFERVRDAVHPAVNGLSLEELTFRPDSESNSIAWLVWHLTRIQDDHVAGLDGDEQVWTGGGWAARFGLPLTPRTPATATTPMRWRRSPPMPTCCSATSRTCTSGHCGFWARSPKPT